MIKPQEATDDYILIVLKKCYFGMFSFGFMVAVSLFMTGIATNANEFKNVVLFSICTVLFLSISLAINYTIAKSLLPELKSRLESRTL